jgi:hypothetical protein
MFRVHKKHICCLSQERLKTLINLPILSGSSSTRDIFGGSQTRNEFYYTALRNNTQDNKAAANKPAVKVKGKVNLITCYEGPDGKMKYSSNFSLTSSLDGVGGQRHAPAAVHTVRDPILTVKDAGCAPGSVWTVQKISPPL